MYGNESPQVDQEFQVPVSATPSRVAERQKQQRTLEYLLQMDKHKKSDKVNIVWVTLIHV